MCLQSYTVDVFFFLWRVSVSSRLARVSGLNSFSFDLSSTNSQQISLSNLPNEILCMVAHQQPTQASISALMRTNRQLYHLLREHLYDRTPADERDDVHLWACEYGVEDLVRAMRRRGADV